MVVDYFHVFGAIGAFWPFKTNAPLRVDADAVLPLAIAAKRFKVVAGKGGKILQRCCRLENAKARLRLRDPNAQQDINRAQQLKHARPFMVAGEQHSLLNALISSVVAGSLYESYGARAQVRNQLRH